MILRVLYIAGGILSLSIIAFIAVFILYGTGEQEPSQIARFNSSIVDDYLTNTTEETSTQMGKTVNEVQGNSINEIDGEVGNTGVSNENDETKYAVNTSKVEGNKVEETTVDKKEEEEVKDPEFKMPVEGEILREYAKDSLVYSPTLDEWITHNGLDITAAKTTVVKASADGTVKSIKMILDMDLQ